MRTGIKLVQNTHCSLQYWYRTSLVFRRKTNANRNQANWWKIHTGPDNDGYRTSLVLRRKTNAKRYQTGAKIHTGPYNAGREPVWYLEKSK